MAIFIHTGDWGLGGYPADVSDDATRALFRYRRFDAVRRIGEIARDRGAEFVLVVGDVFHTAFPNHATIKEAIEVIASINLPVLIVPSGPNDGIAGSVWEQEFFIREATVNARNLRVLLTCDLVDQNGCLLFPLFPRGELTNPQKLWAHAREQLAPGDPRPRIVIVPATGGADDHPFPACAVVANADIPDIDYVATFEERTACRVAVVKAVRGEQPVVEAVPSESVIIDAEHDHESQLCDLVATTDSLLYCPAPAPTPPTDDNVQFTVFRPQVVAPAKWYELVAAAHLDAARPEADPSEPTPLERVQAKAKAMLGDRFDDYSPLTHDALQGVPQGSELTFAFEMAGVEFNPPRVSFGWFEDEHTVQVRLRATPALDGKTARGRMTVFLGAIILADVPFSLRVDAARAADRPKLEPEREAIRRYRRIFASYSHRDLPIVEQFERFVEATGDRYLRDHKILRAGEAWDDRLLELISEADVFQLFWSRNALASPHVRREWEHALSLDRDNFIRPVYWESPLPQAAGLPPEPLTRIHFQFLGAIAPDVEEQHRPLEADEIVGDDNSSDEASLATSEDGLEIELGCADFDESEWDLESAGLALEDADESADVFPAEAAMNSACPPSMARFERCSMPVDDAGHVSAAAGPACSGKAFIPWWGMLVGFCIVVVILGLIAALFSAE
jgi:hypothetical protein